MLKRSLKISIGVVLGGLCVWLVMRRIDTAEIVSTLVDVDLGILSVAVLCLLVAQVFRAWVWVVLSRPTVEIPLRRALRLVLIGNLANIIVPFRGGELARVWLLGVKGGVGSGRAATIILIERTVDMLILVCLVAVGAMVLGLSDWLGPGTIKLGVGVAVAIVIVLVLYALRRRLGDLARRIESIPKVGRQASKLITQFGDGLDQLQARSTLTAIVALATSWALVIVGLELRLAAFDIDVPLGGSVALLAVGNIALSVPMVPAGIGVYEYATVLCLERFGVADAPGFAFAAASHALSIAVLALAGAIAFAIDQGVRKRSRSGRESSTSMRTTEPDR